MPMQYRIDRESHFSSDMFGHPVSAILAAAEWLEKQ
jgi:hypothetical protein